MKNINKYLIYVLSVVFVNSVYSYVPYKIQPKYILVDQCQNIKFSSGITDFEKKFYKAFCLYIKGEKKNVLINSLRKAYQSSSIPEINSLIQLLMAESYAEKAKKYHGIYKKGNSDKSTYYKDKMCSGRKHAIDLYNATDWKFVSPSYTEDENIENGQKKRLPTTEYFINKMTSYYEQGEVLNSSLNGVCGIIDGIKDTDIDRVVDINFRKIMDDFFGSEDPIKAMFARKNKRILFVKESASNKIKFYNEKKDPLNERYLSYQNRYNEIKNEINVMVTNYSEYTVRVKSELDNINVFNSGDSVSSSGENTKLDLTDKAQNIQQRLDSVENKKIVDKLAGINKSFKNLDESERGNQKIMESLCRVYYCYYISYKKPQYDLACSYADIKIGNPLCNKKGHIFSVGGEQFDLGKMCISAGLSGVYANDSISPDNAKKCIKEIKL